MLNTEWKTHDIESVAKGREGSHGQRTQIEGQAAEMQRGFVGNRPEAAVSNDFQRKVVINILVIAPRTSCL